MDLINAYVKASDSTDRQSPVWHFDYNQYDEIIYDYQALGKRIMELLTDYDSLQQRKRRSLPFMIQVSKRRGTER